MSDFGKSLDLIFARVEAIELKLAAIEDRLDAVIRITATHFAVANSKERKA